MAVAKPPVIPGTDEAACMSFNVPTATEPVPPGLKAVAVSAAKADELTNEPPPINAATMIKIFAVNLPIDLILFIFSPHMLIASLWLIALTPRYVPLLHPATLDRALDRLEPRPLFPYL